MAEFLTIDEAKSKFGTKGRTNAGLTLGIIGTALAATSETITTLTPTVTKVIDVIIPNGVSIVSQQVLDELPTSLPVKGHCAYSVFDVRVTPAPAPTAAIASVAKSK